MMKEFRELRRDRRTLAMLVVLPLLLLVIFGFAANFTVTTLTVTITGPGAEELAAQIAQSPEADHLNVVAIDETASDPDRAARDALRDDNSDIAIVTPGGQKAVVGAPPTLYIDGSNLFAAQSAKVVAAQLGDTVHSEILFNPDLTTSWVMVPALIGLILTFIGTIVTSIGLVKERASGTLEQLAVMPIKPSSVIAGKIAPYLILASIDMIVVTLLGMWIFGVPFNGNVLVFALGALIFLFVVLGIGVFISTISNNVGQAIQTAIFFLLPQILLSGMIFPLDAMAPGVRWIGYCLPLTYFTKISQGVMLRGEPMSSLWLSFVVLVAMAILIFTAAVWRFRASITPGRVKAAR